MMIHDPEPRTAPDELHDAPNQGASTPQPAEGADDAAPPTDGSPQG